LWARVDLQCGCADQIACSGKSHCGKFGRSDFLACALVPVRLQEVERPIRLPNLALLGIIISSEDHRAVVRVRSTNGAPRLRLGDKLGRWRVTWTERDQLVLSFNHRSATFEPFSDQGSDQAKVAAVSAYHTEYGEVGRSKAQP
jgi:hypothetical protein